jgi:hypothetical protein
MAAAALALATVAVVIGAEIRNNPPAALTVHEWGTFTSVAGDDGGAVDWDVLGGKDDLPGFINNRGYRCFKFRLTGTVRMETPVLYFYSARPVNAHVRVAFPKGLITEWYPQADYQIDQQSSGGPLYRLPSNLNGIDTSMRSVVGGVEWTNVKIEPESAAPLPLEKKPSHYYAARATDAAPVTVGNEHEKFLFYRGVGRFPVPLSARVSPDGSVVVANTGADPVPMAMLFENRGGRIGYRDAGAISGPMTLSRPSLDGSLPKLRHDLEEALVAQGLFRKEARAMVETWRDSWFEEGTRLIYIVPSRAVDAILPLEIAPAPAEINRVFVGRIELITAETRRAVEAAMLAGDRSIADRYGRFLEPILSRMAKENPANASRIQGFLSSVRMLFESACY